MLDIFLQLGGFQLNQTNFHSNMMTVYLKDFQILRYKMASGKHDKLKLEGLLPKTEPACLKGGGVKNLHL